MVPTCTTIGSVQPESYVTVHALSTLAHKGARVTVDTGPDRVKADSGPEEEKVFPTWGTFTVTLSAFQLVPDRGSRGFDGNERQPS